MLNAFSRTASMMTSSLLEGNSSRNFRSLLGSAGLLSAVAICSLAACNIRWKYLVPALLGKRQPRKLPTVKVEATEDEEDGIKSISIILLHGMWQNATYFKELQEFLSEDGYTSYAVDLLPGERLLPGGSGQELVEDLECTLKGIEGPYVLLGHSKGGLIVQRALQQSEMIQSQAVGVVLMGSYPLGLPPPMSLFQQKRNMFQDVIGVLFVTLLGKIRNCRYAKDIFLLQSTDETSKEISNYLNTIVKAPADGILFLPYHYSPINTPALIMGASHDILCPPLVLKGAFDKRFTKATHVMIPHQAHSFRDKGWEISMLEPLVDWLNVESKNHQDTLEWTKLVETQRQNEKR